METETVIKELISPEEQNQQSIESVKKNIAPNTNVVEDKEIYYITENVGNELEKEKSKAEVTCCATPRETLEILSVELVGPRKAENPNDETMESSNIEECAQNKSLNEEKPISTQDKGTEEKEKSKAEVTCCATPRETLEILSVELVGPRKAENPNDETMESSNIEECAQNKSLNEEKPISTQDKEIYYITENVGNELEKEKSKAEVTCCATPRETLEILSVELVGPRKAENPNDETMESSNIEECAQNKSLNEEKPISTQDSNCETTENKNQNEFLIDVNLESNKMETNNENAPSPEIEDSENTDEPTTNTLESSNTGITSGLGLLAQYDSDNEGKISDTDSVIEVPIAGQEYRNQVVEIDSDSGDSSDSSDVEYLSVLRKTIEKRMEVVDDDDEEDEDGNIGKKKHITKLKVKGEMLLEDLPPIQDLQITVPEDQCIEFGKIHSVVDQLVLVSALPNAILLDLETVIFLEKGQKVLGEVFDVLGQVADPMYCVRFNSNKQIKEKEINVGDVVYVAPKTQYTQYVILSSLMKLKGSDASWENDMEPPPRFLDYSDDEQEQLARRQLRNKDRPVDNDDPTKKSRTMDEADNISSNRSQHSNTQQRIRYSEQRNNNRGGSAGHFNANTRTRYNAPQNNQQRTPNPSHHRNSWHSNYYPQSYPNQPAVNYGMPPAHNQPQQSQAYPSNLPMYAMPPVHNMSYPPPSQPTQYGAPPMLHQHAPQLMTNTFSIRPPTLHGHPHHNLHYQQYTSPPPPPPGSQ